MWKFLVLILIVHCTLKIENCVCQWSTQTFPFSGVVYGIAFKDVNNGVACGHTFGSFGEMLYYTTNSGTTGHMRHIRLLCGHCLRFNILTQQLYMQAVRKIMSLLCQQKKYDSGFEKLPDYMKNHFLRLGINGLLGEYRGAFVKSTNSGLSWTKVTIFDTTSGFVSDIQFFNESTGYAGQVPAVLEMAKY